MKVVSLKCFENDIYPFPDKLHLFINFLLLRSSINKTKDGFTIMYSKKMKECFGNEYLNLIQYLLKKRGTFGEELLVRDNHYKVEERSIGYKLTRAAMESGVYIHELKAGSVKRKFLARKKLAKKPTFLQNFEFDTAAYITWLDNSDLSVETIIQQRALTQKWINDEHWNIRDQSSRRLHHTLTGLKKEARKFIRYRSQSLVECDLKNCQPFLLASLIDNPKLLRIASDIKVSATIAESLENISSTPDTKDFINLCASGAIYEFIAACYQAEFKEQIERTIVKKKFLMMLFDKVYESSKIGIVIKKRFPEIFKFLKTVNSSKEGSRSLACVLQRIESFIFIDRIAAILEKEKIPFFPIHDALYTTDTKSHLVKELIILEAYALTGKNPIVTLNQLTL